ncbi:TCP17 [Symbiodinium necroappetens]|uniref:TCP17 protein n=1 Tax=Symbiodinium necroappetens TaxID=1628268 RepID=A0A812VXT3_9DINO|nr:TCP17 [Symbiodinium necroappetens]
MPLSSRITELGLSIPTSSKPLAVYVPAVRLPTTPEQIVVSGQVPLVDGAPLATGRVPNEVSIELAQECARRCVLNALAAVAGVVDGDLDRIDRVVRLGCFVACDASFTEHPKVANGASELLHELLGEKGRHARAAVGVPSLPLGVPVEIEFQFLLRP